MQIPYRQGVLRGQIDAIYLTKQYLQRDVSYVNINVIPTNLQAVAAHKNKNYLIQEPEIVNHAWGPMSTGVDCLLYWDVNTATGAVTRGFTTAGFTYGLVLPSSPILDQHWFNVGSWVMNVWDGTNWIEKIRVFAGTFNSTSGIVSEAFASQINDATQSIAGYILYDLNARGVIDPSDETFVNTGDGLTVQLGAFTMPLSLDNSVAYMIASEPIPDKSLVSIAGQNRVGLASISSGRLAIGMVEAGVVTGSTVRLTFSGIIYNDQWNFDVSLMGRPIYLGENGAL